MTNLDQMKDEEGNITCISTGLLNHPSTTKVCGKGEPWPSQRPTLVFLEPSEVPNSMLKELNSAGKTSLGELQIASKFKTL